MLLCCSSITCLGLGLTHCFIDIQILIYKSFALFSHEMCLRDVKVPATAGCMVGGIMDQEVHTVVSSGTDSSVSRYTR